MAYNHLYVDSDVLLDLLLERKHFFEYSQLLFIQAKYQQIELSTSALVIANINYIASKKLGAAATKESIRNLLKLVNVLPFESDIVNKALDSNFADFEDAIQNFIAERYNCEAIITRNIKDYKQANLPVYTTEQFLNTLN
jgi:predicted nucleic acid-binding protein